jgi:hypothetical protein
MGYAVSDFKISRTMANLHKWPEIIIADFDLSFFDLQSEGDIYQDNPFHYSLSYMPHSGKESDSGGRNPPVCFSLHPSLHSTNTHQEIFQPYLSQLVDQRDRLDQTDRMQAEDFKMSSKTDVWFIGQVRNIPPSPFPAH